MKKLLFYSRPCSSALHHRRSKPSGVEHQCYRQINSDNSVTFRLLAPDAQSVKVTGDFLPSTKMKTLMATLMHQGSRPFVKNDKGLWEFKSQPLNSELYSYNFIVNGVRVLDPPMYIWTVMWIRSRISSSSVALPTISTVWSPWLTVV